MTGQNVLAVEPPPLVVTPGVWTALAVGALGSAPLLPSLSRWTVTVDAVTTSALMLVSAAIVFTWRSVTGVIGAVLRLGRR